MNKANIPTNANYLNSILVESTDSYTAISHGSIISKTQDLLSKHNINILGESYHHCNDGKIAQGKYLLGVNNADFGLELAWQNSVNKQVSFKYAVGSQTFVCTNSACFGTLGSYKRIHTGIADVEAYETMEDFIQHLEENFTEQVELYKKMKEIEITKKTCAGLIGRMFMDDEIITITQLGIINKELHNPSFDYGVENTVYNLFQHCTHSFKEVTPRTWLPKQLELSDFFINEFSL